MTNRPTQDAIEGLLQDMGETCTNTMMELGNGELHITEANASDWHRIYAELGPVLEKIMNLVERSKEPDPCPPEYIPIYGVTNGRGRIIA